jgi:hypothetical protein
MRERDVKRDVSRFLNQLKIADGSVYFEMPVPTGWGKSGLDYTICYCGFFVSIETKAPGEWLTPRQRDTAIAILKAGGKVFIISAVEGLDAFKRWAAQVGRGMLDAA